MKCYIVCIDKREGDGNFLGPYGSKESALKGFREYVNKRYSDRSIERLIEAYGGSLEEGELYSEEETIYIVERELVP